MNATVEPPKLGKRIALLWFRGQYFWRWIHQYISAWICVCLLQCVRKCISLLISDHSCSITCHNYIFLFSWNSSQNEYSSGPYIKTSEPFLYTDLSLNLWGPHKCLTEYHCAVSERVSLFRLGIIEKVCIQWLGWTIFFLVASLSPLVVNLYAHLSQFAGK